jgi:predicted regulator of Ras-like GTPase activity (Roadblock/LC7/MglB family)
VPYNVDINWMLDDLVARIPQIEKAVVLTRDGLAIGASGVLVQEDVERLAAMAAGFHSLARGAATYLIAYEVRQIIVEMAGAYMFITAAGDNGCLTVVAKDTVDLGLLAYETALFVKRVSAHLPPVRHAALGPRTT